MSNPLRRRYKWSSSSPLTWYLYLFRRFVKTTISDLGYFDFSEYFMGHSGSTYWRKKDSEKAEIINKIEPYLTFVNVQLETRCQYSKQNRGIRGAKPIF
jgi:hypothetical protein